MWSSIDFLSSWTNFLKLYWLLFLYSIFKSWHSLLFFVGPLFKQHAITRQYYSQLKHCIPILHLQSRSLFPFLPHTVNSLLTSSTWCLADTSNSTCQTEIIVFSPVLFLHWSLFWIHDYNVYSCISQNLYSYFLQLSAHCLCLTITKFCWFYLPNSTSTSLHTTDFMPVLAIIISHLKSCIYLLPGLHWLILGPLTFFPHPPAKMIFLK